MRFHFFDLLLKQFRLFLENFYSKNQEFETWQFFRFPFPKIFD